MARNLLIALLLLVAFGCKKKFSDDDTTLYKWKRDLYRARVKDDGPAIFYSRDPKVSRNPDAVFLSSEEVVLTEYRKDKQQDSIYKASGKTQVYKYEKIAQQ
ncbi:hypothetical protein [Pedobacter sp. JY14-1]|uniref:hypothetical protein n=1 Tax=Pedobacter sp. JY14-1 TaxID=3034151 RepID=UPI0023E0C193|nr:hypothetical protein [Pedobacter sp. JY14-1]